MTMAYNEDMPLYIGETTSLPKLAGLDGGNVLVSLHKSL